MKLHLPAATLGAVGLHPPVGRWEQDAPGGGRGRPGGRGAVSAISMCPLPREPGNPWPGVPGLHFCGCIVGVHILCFLKQGSREGE